MREGRGGEGMGEEIDSIFPPFPLSLPTIFPFSLPSIPPPFSSPYPYPFSSSSFVFSFYVSGNEVGRSNGFALLCSARLDST